VYYRSGAARQTAFTGYCNSKRFYTWAHTHYHAHRKGASDCFRAIFIDCIASLSDVLLDVTIGKLPSNPNSTLTLLYIQNAHKQRR
jgi:hypothetical protein